MRRPEKPPVLVLAALLTFTWYTHLVPAVIAAGVCVLVVVVAGLGKRRAGSANRRVPGLGRVAAACVAPLALTVVYIATSPPGSTIASVGSFFGRVKRVLGLTWPAVSTVQVEYWIYRSVALVLYVAALTALVSRLRAGWRTRPADGLLLAAMASGTLALLSPHGVSTGGTFLGLRFALFVPLWLAAWVAVQLAGLKADRPQLRTPVLGVGVVASAVVLLLVGLRFPVQEKFGRLIDEVREVGDCLPENSTVIQLGLDDGSDDVPALGPMQDQVGFLAADRAALDMGNLSGWVPYFLWRYLPGQRPDLVLNTGRDGILYVPPRVDIAGALDAGFRLDAVVVYGRPYADPDVLRDADTQQALADLESSFELVAVSSGKAAELWLRNGLEPSCTYAERPVIDS